jgi:hypothetical protein
VPVTARPSRELGFDRDVLDVPADFDAPLPEDLVDEFER